jgi:hypothetical protein
MANRLQNYTNSLRNNGPAYSLLIIIGAHKKTHKRQATSRGAGKIAYAQNK